MPGKGHALSRDELIRVLTVYTGTTTGLGAADGSTLVDSALIGVNDFVTNKTILIMSGDAINETKQAIVFDDTTGTITVAPPFNSQIAIGTLFRIINLSAGSTLAILLSYQGLVYHGAVTTVDLATQFRVAGLAGFGNAYFANTYRVYVVRDAAGGGAAPQGEMQPCTAYTSVGGIFTHTAFTVGLAVGDEVLLIHESIATIGLRGDAAAAGVVTGTDSIVALLKQAVTQQGLIYFGDVTGFTDANNFASTDLANRENDYFKDWYVYCVRDDGGAGAAPQGEYRLITDYTGDATGAFVHNAFSANLAVGDQVMIIHPALYEILTIRGGAETLESLDDELDAILDVAKEPDTTTLTGFGTEDVLFDRTGVVPFFIAGVWLGLENMAAGDVIRFRAYADWDDASIADLISDDEVWTFGQAQTPKWVYMPLNIYVTYEFKVTGETLDGTDREVYCVVDTGVRGT